MDHDRPTTTIAEFVASVRSNDLSDSAKNAAVRHHLDTIACALGGFSTEPNQIARNIGRASLSPSGCSVFGVEEKVAPEQAVFANSTMVRQLDFNDVAYVAAGRPSGHPSDFIPAIFAAAELIGATGIDVVRGILVGYEVLYGLATVYPMPLYAAGWDATALLVGISGAMGAGSVFGLNVEELSNAVAFALVPSMPLLATRHGVISNWKGSASAHAAMTGLFAARLAREGLTGPRAPFDGEDGLHRQVAPTDDLAFDAALGAMDHCALKYHPVCGAMSSIVEPLTAIKGKFDPNDVAKISVEMHEFVWKMVGGGSGDREAVWNPQTREAADHSFPYVVAIGILDGDVTLASYSPDRFVDPAVHALMEVTTVSPSADFTSLDPIGSRVNIELRNGDVIEVESIIPTGHLLNPMSNEQLSKKFKQAVDGLLSDEASSTLETALWNLEDLTDLDELSRCYRAI